MSHHRQGGVTLIELVMAIVVIGTAMAGVAAVMNLTSAASADPMLQTQAQALARAYLEEILLREYVDPDGSEAGEDRATFDDVDDYHALAVNGCLTTSPACPALGDCPCDQDGVPIDGLADYEVAIVVATTTLNGDPAQRVDVAVTHARLGNLRVDMTGYRTQY